MDSYAIKGIKEYKLFIKSGFLNRKTKEIPIIYMLNERIERVGNDIFITLDNVTLSIELAHSLLNSNNKNNKINIEAEYIIENTTSRLEYSTKSNYNNVKVIKLDQKCDNKNGFMDGCYTIKFKAKSINVFHSKKLRD